MRQQHKKFVRLINSTLAVNGITTALNKKSIFSRWWTDTNWVKKLLGCTNSYASITIEIHTETLIKWKEENRDREREKKYIVMIHTSVYDATVGF